MSAPGKSAAEPLSVITIATGSIADTQRFYAEGLGLRCRGPLTSDEESRRARSTLWAFDDDLRWQEYVFERAGVADAARLRVLQFDPPLPAWRGGWEPAVLGPYTIGFPNTRQEALHARLAELGFGARNPVEHTTFRHADGRSWGIAESLALAPDHVAAVGIERGAGEPPISPVDEHGLGGPCYSMCVVEDVDRSARFLQRVLGLEIRNRRRQRSSGTRGAMDTPDGTEFEIAQCYPAGARFGFLILIQFVNLPVRMPERLPRLPACGLCSYGFAVRDVDASLQSAIDAGATDVRGPMELIEPVLGPLRCATFVAPGGIPLEIFASLA